MKKFRISTNTVVQVEAKDAAEATELATSLIESVPDYRLEEGRISVEDVYDVSEMEEEEKLYLNCYAVSRQYGGPEEGGWYYDAGRLLRSVNVTGWTDDDTEIEKKHLTEQYGWPKEGRNGRYSVNGGEDFEIHMEDGPGADYPKERPHYE